MMQHKSAITDHADRNDSIIDCEGTKVIDRESNRNARWIKEAVLDQKDNSAIMNQDEGGYRLQNSVPDEGYW